MEVLRNTHRRLAALVDAGHGLNHPELYELLERIESIIIIETGEYIIPESERRIHYGVC